MAVFITVRMADGGKHIELGSIKGDIYMSDIIAILTISLCMEIRRMATHTGMRVRVRNKIIKVLSRFLNIETVWQCLPDLVKIAMDEREIRNKGAKG